MDINTRSNTYQTSVEEMKTITFELILVSISTKFGNKCIKVVFTNNSIGYNVFHNGNLMTAYPTLQENAIKIYNSIILENIKTFDYMIENKLTVLILFRGINNTRLFYDEINNFPTQYNYLGETFIIIHSDHETTTVVKVDK